MTYQIKTKDMVQVLKDDLLKLEQMVTTVNPTMKVFKSCNLWFCEWINGCFLRHRFLFTILRTLFYMILMHCGLSFQYKPPDVETQLKELYQELDERGEVNSTDYPLYFLFIKKV